MLIEPQVRVGTSQSSSFRLGPSRDVPSQVTALTDSAHAYHGHQQLVKPLQFELGLAPHIWS